MKSEPSSPHEVCEFLIELFPEFSDELDYEDYEEMNYHSLFIDFIYFWGKYKSSFSTKQFEAFSSFVNKAVEKEGALENAVSTCFLEHLHHKAVKCIKPMLSTKALKRLHP